MSLPSTAHANFKLLTDTYRDHSIEFPKLKATTLAHWALESAWGKTGLATKHMNYAGMKWDSSLEMFACPVLYNDKRKYAAFTNQTHFIDAYWDRLDSLTLGQFRQYTADDKSFITYVIPAWLSSRAPDKTLTRAERVYCRDILNVVAGRTQDLFD